MGSLLSYIQIFLSVILVVAILMQQTDASMGATFGGSEDTNPSGRTRRGFEKTLFKATIGIAVLLVISSFASFLI